MAYACAYCRQSHPSTGELEACAAAFWARIDAEAKRLREEVR